MHRPGHVVSPTSPTSNVPFSSALFDSGALAANYISPTYVESNLSHLSHLLKPINSYVRLGDATTIKTITSSITLTLSFVDSSSNSHLITSEFLLLETGNDFIIGLPTIVGQLHVFFQSLITDAVNSAPRSRLSNSLSNIAVTTSPTLDPPLPAPNIGDILSPWITTPELAPEELSDPHPCSFPDPLHFLEMSHLDAVAEYHAMFDAHVTAEFANSTPILELLRTKGKQVFCPTAWEGINGINPIELDISPDIPKEFHTARRNVNPKIFDNARKEFDRLKQYFYLPSKSPYAHPLVIAPKATQPFIRFCGSYDLFANKYVSPYPYPIPHVPDMLAKAKDFRIFADLDLQNAFHQLLLGPNSRRLLAVQTPWGVFEPKFLPEGVGPASPYLQSIVADIFADMSDFCIVIYDNILICAHDHMDLYNKFERILDRCIERNLYCKFAKTWLGQPSAKFFGYHVQHNGYRLTQDRIDAIQAIAFPTNLKQAQTFFGSSVFFRTFVPDYTTAAGHLHDLLQKDFSWDTSTWSHDYAADFQSFKDHLCRACFLHFPDYTLVWLVRVDSSDFGVGGVLLQVVPATTPDGQPTYQPIAFFSHKYSVQALRWSTIEKECYSCFFTVKLAANYLMGKRFILETDHANLVWMEKSTVPKIIRWRMFLQSFDFVIRHIPGKNNIIADWFSRLYHSYSPFQLTNLLHLAHDNANSIIDPVHQLHQFTMISDVIQLASDDLDFSSSDDVPLLCALTPNEAFAAVHNSKLGHHGTCRTYRLLNKHFPGHRIPIRLISEFIHSCPACQKHRLRHHPIKPLNRVLAHPHHRSTIGVDLLTVTPETPEGFKYLVVIMNLFSKFVSLYPAKEKTAINLANCLMRHFAAYGLIDSIISDPGSDLTSEVIEHLNSYLGIRHTISLVDRHESNGVERVNQEILRHLRTIIHDNRLIDDWSDPVTLAIVQLILNEQPTPALGNHSPLVIAYGSADALYFKLPESSSSSTDKYNTYVQRLDTQIATIRAISMEAQAAIANARVEDTPADTHNVFQPGDYVLFIQHHRPSKLSAHYLGPYEVISQYKNDVVCKHLVSHVHKTLHTDNLQPFFGDAAAALDAALRDNNQHHIQRIITFKGDPFRRHSTSFQVEFADGDIIWKNYDKDLSDTSHFEEFCRSHQYLWPLVFPLQIDADKRNREIIKSPITYNNGDSIFVNLFAWTADKFHSYDLPDSTSIAYYILATCSHKKISESEPKIKLTFPVFKVAFTVNNSFLHSYAKSALPPNATLVTAAFAQQYPKVLT